MNKAILEISYEEGTLTPQQIAKLGKSFDKCVPRLDRKEGTYIKFEDKIFRITRVFFDLNKRRRIIEIKIVI